MQIFLDPYTPNKSVSDTQDQDQENGEHKILISYDGLGHNHNKRDT